MLTTIKLPGSLCFGDTHAWKFGQEWRPY